MIEIPYRYGNASKKAKSLIVGIYGQFNPIKPRKRKLPLDIMKVGDSLYFHKLEMIKPKWQLAKDTVKRYNNKYNDMFGIIEDDVILEIVRIK